jgi:uncharacterized protein (DUF1330 family)
MNFNGRIDMKYATIGISLVVGAAIGAAAIEGLHAQATLAAYSVSEITIADEAGYAPISQTLQAENKKVGARPLARGTKVEAIEGTAPKRVVINQWPSMDAAKKFYSSPVVKKAFEDRKKFTSGQRTFIVEALPN